MLTALTLALLPLVAPAHPSLCADEVDERIAAAGDDVGRLAELALALEVEGLEDAAQRAWSRVLELDAEHAGAHEALRHHSYDGKWFESYAALSAYRKAEDERMLAEHGLVRFGDDWVEPASVPFRRMGWVETEGGTWRSARDVERAERAAELAARGWQQQDLTWIDPAEFDRWREGLWRCGDEWLAPADADTYHASLDRPWRVPGEHFVVQSTLDRQGTDWAVWYAEQAYADLVRAYGVEPAQRPTLVVVRDIPQYNAFAAGDPAAGRGPTEASGESSIHYAYFADAWFDTGVSPAAFRAAGVCYWDRGDERLAPYGQHAVRHAAAQSYAEAIDPSWDAVSRAIATSRLGQDSGAFWGEKRIPRWFRYGVASYTERYFRDVHAAEGADPWWPRAWALDNLRRQGGLRPLPEVFAFRLDPANEPEDAGKLLHEAGLVVAFVLDGGCAPVQRAHAELKRALQDGADVEPAARALREALEAHRAELDAWASL